MASLGAWLWKGSHPKYKPDKDRSLLRISAGNYRGLVRSYNATRDNLAGEQKSYPGGWEFTVEYLGKDTSAGGDGRAILNFLLDRENDGGYFSWYNPAVNPTPDPAEIVTLGRHLVMVKNWTVANRRMGLVDIFVTFVEVPFESVA